MRWRQRHTTWLLFAFLVMAAACTTATESSQPEDTPTEAAAQAETTTTLLPTDTPRPQATPLPSSTPESPPTHTAVPPTTPSEAPTPVPEPIVPVGSTASWTLTNDTIGIEGEIEFTSATQLVIRDFVFLAAEAPGVDIRLGMGDDFSDAVSVSLRDITGKTYEGRSLTLTIPPAAFDGRSFDSIAVVCFDTGDVFDSALIERP